MGGVIQWEDWHIRPFGGIAWHRRCEDSWVIFRETCRNTMKTSSHLIFPSDYNLELDRSSGYMLRAIKCTKYVAEPSPFDWQV
jgi:hypothetical protein